MSVKKRNMCAPPLRGVFIENLDGGGIPARRGPWRCDRSPGQVRGTHRPLTCALRLSSLRSDGVARVLSAHGLALWPYCTPGESKTYAGRHGLLGGLFPQEVTKTKRHRMALPPCDKR